MPIPAYLSPMPRLAIAQLRPTKGDYGASLQKIGGVLAQIAKLDPPADLVVFPETATSGYFVEGGVRDVAVTAGGVVPGPPPGGRGAGAPPRGAGPAPQGPRRGESQKGGGRRAERRQPRPAGGPGGLSRDRHVGLLRGGRGTRRGRHGGDVVPRPHRGARGRGSPARGRGHRVLRGLPEPLLQFVSLRLPRQRFSRQRLIR